MAQRLRRPLPVAVRPQDLQVNAALLEAEHTAAQRGLEDPQTQGAFARAEEAAEAAGWKDSGEFFRLPSGLLWQDGIFYFSQEVD